MGYGSASVQFPTCTYRAIAHGANLPVAYSLRMNSMYVPGGATFPSAGARTHSRGDPSSAGTTSSGTRRWSWSKPCVTAARRIRQARVAYGPPLGSKSTMYCWSYCMDAGH